MMLLRVFFSSLMFSWQYEAPRWRSRTLVSLSLPRVNRASHSYVGPQHARRQRISNEQENMHGRAFGQRNR